MKLEKLAGIITEAELLQQIKHHDRSKILILLKPSDFKSLFDEFSKYLSRPNGMPITTMYKCYGFEFRPHNIENQDVLICLKHKVK